MKFGIARGTSSPGPYAVEYRRRPEDLPDVSHRILIACSHASFATAYGVVGRGVSASQTGVRAGTP